VYQFLFLNKKYWFVILLHLALGIVSALSSQLLIIWFFGVLIANLNIILSGKFPQFIIISTYLISMEILGRMAGTTPFIPYELGKYLTPALCLVGIIRFGTPKRGLLLQGLLLSILAIPGVLMGFYGGTDNLRIIFNVMGMINTGIITMFLSGRRMYQRDYIHIMKALLLPLLSVLAFAYFRTPSYEELEFSLNAQFSTSGGFGSNQVSTALGLGIICIFFFLIYQLPLSGYKIFDIVLMALFLLQGLLTFSRGGIIGALLFILLFVFLARKIKIGVRWYGRQQVFSLLIPIIGFMYLTYIYADNVTGGLLSLRYQGETAGTLAGTREKSLATLTSQRNIIFEEDLDVFLNNIFLGVGVGQSPFYRNKTQGIVAHVEFSRLLSEHGMLGLIYTFILAHVGITLYRRYNFSEWGIFQLILFILAIYTTFHAATRTYVTPLLIGLSLITIVNDKNTLPGKQIRKT
jgi:hypothetical protein